MYLLIICYVNSFQLCLTLYNPMDYSLPGSSVSGILQARILGWVAISSSRRSSWPRAQTCVSYVSASAGGLFTTSTTWDMSIQILCSFKKNLIIYLPNIELQTFLNFGKESPLSDRYMVWNIFIPFWGMYFLDDIICSIQRLCKFVDDI